MATVLHRNPVAVSHPITGQFITLSRGKEFDDNDPVVAAFAWAFEPDDAPATVDSVPIETATARPGERRSTRRR
jgi:hypothetical protein